MFLNRLHVKMFSVNRIPSYCFCSSSDKKKQKIVVERVITPGDVDLFSKLTGDFNPIHTSCENRLGVVHGAFLNGIVSGVIGTKLPGHGSVVLSQTLNFPNPCYVDDTVEITVEVEDIRKILNCDYEVRSKSSGEVVMKGCAKIYFRTLKDTRTDI